MANPSYLCVLVFPAAAIFELRKASDESSIRIRARRRSWGDVDPEASFYFVASRADVVRLEDALRKLLACHTPGWPSGARTGLFALDALPRAKRYAALLGHRCGKPWRLVQGIPRRTADPAVNHAALAERVVCMNPGRAAPHLSLPSRPMDDADERARVLEPSGLIALVKGGREPGKLTLRGAFVKCWPSAYGRLRIVLRDSSYQNMASLEADVPKPTVWLERGQQIEVAGELGEPALQRDNPLNTERVFRGASALCVRGWAPGLIARQECSARIRTEMTHARAQLKRCDTLYVVTSRDSHGHRDVMAELADRTKIKRLPATCALEDCNLHDPQTIADAMRRLLDKANDGDVVIAVRGGGEWLDHFEDPRVIEALGKLALQCPTYVAIGHASDKFSLLEGIVLKSFRAPGVAIGELDELLRTDHAARPRHVDVEVDVVPVEPPCSDAAVEQAPPSAASAAPAWRTASQYEPSWSEARPPSPVPSARRRSTHRREMVVGLVMGLIALALGFGARRAGFVRAPEPPTNPAPAATAKVPAPEVHAVAGRPTARKPVTRDRGHVSTLGAPLAATTPQTLARAAPPEQGTPVGAARALRLVNSRIAPFVIGNGLAEARERCAEQHGMWMLARAARCRMPGGREYLFGSTGALVHTITLRQLGDGPVPLLSEGELAALQELSASGRGPFVLTVSPQQLTVRARIRHPGL